MRAAYWDFRFRVFKLYRNNQKSIQSRIHSVKPHCMVFDTFWRLWIRIWRVSGEYPYRTRVRYSIVGFAAYPCITCCRSEPIHNFCWRFSSSVDGYGEPGRLTFPHHSWWFTYVIQWERIHDSSWEFQVEDDEKSKCVYVVEIWCKQYLNDKPDSYSK